MVFSKMILVRASHQNVERDVRRVMGILDLRIWAGMRNGARETAQSVAETAKDILTAKLLVNKDKPKKDRTYGPLADAIGTSNADPGFKNFARYDVVVDTKRAPYADWVEAGADAIELPYSLKGGKDFSTSSFKGHHYMEGAFKEHEDGKAEQIVGEEIIKALVAGK